MGSSKTREGVLVMKAHQTRRTCESAHEKQGSNTRRRQRSGRIRTINNTNIVNSTSLGRWYSGSDADAVKLELQRGTSLLQVIVLFFRHTINVPLG